MKKQLELLRILVALKELGEGTATAIQKEAKIGNYYATKNVLSYLKERGIVEVRYDPGPPGKYVYYLTDKGKKAAELAEKLLLILEE